MSKPWLGTRQGLEEARCEMQPIISLSGRRCNVHVAGGRSQAKEDWEYMDTTIRGNSNIT